MKKYCILGTDLRTKYLRKLYTEKKERIVDLEQADIVITSIPFSKDGIKVQGEILTCEELIENLKGTEKVLISGAISKNIRERLEEYKIKYYDIMDNDSMAIYNAIPTAEGAIAVAIGNTDFTLHGSNILILGFGRVGKVLANKIKGLDANVYCEARKEMDISLINAMGYIPVKLEDLEIVLPNMDVIFNTIPKLILDSNRLNLVKDNTLIIDLASSPGGVDLNYAKENNKKVEWSLAIPSKVAPYTAAVYIKNEIDRIVNFFLL